MKENISYDRPSPTYHLNTPMQIKHSLNVANRDKEILKFAFLSFILKVGDIWI